MKKYVVFTSNNARIIKNPPTELEKAILELPEFFLNPDLTAVKGYAPHFWRVKDGKIAPMHPDEWIPRRLDLIENGAQNDIFLGKERSKMRRYKYQARKHANKIILTAAFIASMVLWAMLYMR